jgi:hypothetical protein
MRLPQRVKKALSVILNERSEMKNVSMQLFRFYSTT